MEGMRRGDVWLVALDPTVGAEMQKTRPCVILSPDEMNRHIRTVIVAPLTTRQREYPWRRPTAFRGVQGHVALDQMRAVDKQRLVKRVGELDSATVREILAALAAMFAE
jgi:mRNA interferase MazF